MLRHLLKYTLLSIGVCLCSQCFADSIINRKYQLETAYLFHFAELAQWPEPSSISICMQGDSPLRDYLPVLEGKQIDNTAIHIKLDSPVSLDDCQILFLSDLEALSKSMLEQARKYHVLLVSDAEGFARKGGMIQFTLRDNKLKLVVNLRSVKQAGLKLSSKLLRMAEILE